MNKVRFASKVNHKRCFLAKAWNDIMSIVKSNFHKFNDWLTVKSSFQGHYNVRLKINGFQSRPLWYFLLGAKSVSISTAEMIFEWAPSQLCLDFAAEMAFEWAPSLSWICLLNGLWMGAKFVKISPTRWPSFFVILVLSVQSQAWKRKIIFSCWCSWKYQQIR